MNPKTERCISSAEIIGCNEDLLTEILLRLPSKPLFKFKCISKQWLSIISSHRFYLLYARFMPTAIMLNCSYSSTSCNPLLVPLQEKSASSVPTQIPLLDYLDVSQVKIEQSCNGLLLCSSTFLEANPDNKQVPFSSTLFRKDGGLRFFVCNPSTKLVKRISFPSSAYSANRLMSICLAFDPSKSPHYKVICVFNVSKVSCQVSIYSSETDFWTPLKVHFLKKYRTNFRVGIFSRGAIHWCSSNAITLYFDVNNKSFNTVSMPSRFAAEDGHGWSIYYFGESRGHVHISLTNDPSNLEFDVLEMAEDYSGWFVKYHLNVLSIDMPFLGLTLHQQYKPDTFSVLTIIRSENEEESMLVLFVDGKVIAYNAYDRKSKKIYDLETGIQNPSPELGYGKIHAYQYFESLASV